MFWNFHFSSSGIDTLLSKEDVTLKEILDEEDILQECKTQNSKLIDFLTEDENLKELLHLVVDHPAEDVEETAKYKYKNLACEVMTIDIYSILDKVANNEEFLDIIWEFIERPPPLNPLIASFFSKVISILVCRKSQETFEYLKNHDAVNKFLVHIDVSAIMELFMKIVTVVETQEQRFEIAKWLDEEDLIGKLIDLLSPSEQEEKHYNVSQLLSELIRIGRDSISQYVNTEDPLLITLEKKETVEKLINTMFKDLQDPNSDSSILAGIATLSSMMEIKRPAIEGMEELITPIDLERIASGIHSTLEVLSEQMKNFFEVLTQPNTKASMETTYGTLDPPLGKVRLNIAALVCAAICTNTKIINDAIAETGILNTLLDLFARYEWNNFLHTYVQNCVLAVMNTEVDFPDEEEEGEGEAAQRPIDPLLKHLFHECNIVSRCASIWKDNQISESNGPHGRKGFMGHLTKMMNEIVNAKEKGPNHEHIMSMFNELPDETREQWNDIVSNSLAETNQRNLCVPMNNLRPFESDDSEGDDYKPISISQYDGTLQQAFENYQVQPMTNEFIESFGYDEANVDETENLKNPFDEVGNIDFSINANEESENEKLFESICEQKIKPFDDSDEEEEEDIWEEKQLTFTSATEPRQSSNAIRSDSDSSDEDESGASPVAHDESNNKEEKMEVDTENESESNKGWWTADFSNMDVQGNNSNDSSNWAATEGSDAVSSTGEAFKDFTDISKFDASADSENSSPPVDMETEGSSKPSGASVYEIKMEEDNTNTTAANISLGNENTASPRLTQITVKSVRSPVKSVEPTDKTETKTDVVEDTGNQDQTEETVEPSVDGSTNESAEVIPEIVEKPKDDENSSSSSSDEAVKSVESPPQETKLEEDAILPNGPSQSTDTEQSSGPMT